MDWIPQRLDSGKSSDADEVIEMPSTMMSSSYGVAKSQKFAEPPKNEIGPNKENDSKRQYEPCLNVRLLKVIQLVCCEDCKLSLCVQESATLAAGDDWLL